MDTQRPNTSELFITWCFHPQDISSEKEQNFTETGFTGMCCRLKLRKQTDMKSKKSNYSAASFFMVLKFSVKRKRLTLSVY